jgi:hypothetical protein
VSVLPSQPSVGAASLPEVIWAMSSFWTCASVTVQFAVPVQRLGMSVTAPANVPRAMPWFVVGAGLPIVLYSESQSRYGLAKMSV